MKKKLIDLQEALEGGLRYDDLSKTLYATDASVYRKIPVAVAFPKTVSDIKKSSVLPRTRILALFHVPQEHPLPDSVWAMVL